MFRTAVVVGSLMFASAVFAQSAPTPIVVELDAQQRATAQNVFQTVTNVQNAYNTAVKNYTDFLTPLLPYDCKQVKGNKPAKAFQCFHLAADNKYLVMSDACSCTAKPVKGAK